MSTLLDKFEEHEKEFISVPETLNLIMQATKGTLEQAKDYLLVIKLNEHVPVLYRDEKRLEFKSKPNDGDGNGFESTYRALTSELEGNEYFSIKALNEFRPLDENDIFAHRRGYHYVAQHSVGRFKTGAYVIGLDDSRAEQLLCTGAIEKLTIKEVEDRESKKVKFLTKQLADARAQLAAEQASKATENDKPLIELGEYQKLLITYPLFTAHQIACLLSDYNPVAQDYDSNDTYRLYRDMTDVAVDARLLTTFNEKGQIPSEQVKVWLARRNFIYEGFNDDVVEYLDDEGDPLKRSGDEFAGIIGVVYEMVHKLDAEVEQLSEEYEELRLEYKELEEKNEELVAESKQVKPSSSPKNDKDKGTVPRNQLITIGLLLELLTTPPKGFDVRRGGGTKPKEPLFSSQNKILDEIGSHGIHGQGKSTVGPHFKAGKDALNKSTHDLDVQSKESLQECFDAANEALRDAKKRKER
ncbi:hypothetical protein [Psychrobacter maritimus]|uniref:hypothetical protein n=1 Tax=Psychrobacter maritimus TaxID=256325 RepID=UPI00191A4A4C|nr:hypothetical protein [Psychrobacter maritimus]